MSETKQPPIRLELDGVEDFIGVAASLRATGARRMQAGRGRGNRTFAIDHDITALQAAALIEFIEMGTSEGWLKVSVNAGELDEDGVVEWWEKA